MGHGHSLCSNNLFELAVRSEYTNCKHLANGSYQYGVLVFRETGLDDERHVAFARLFGELDDVKPYLALGRKNRFAHEEIFDVSNMYDDGRLVEVDSHRDHTSRVSQSPFGLSKV